MKTCIALPLSRICHSTVIMTVVYKLIGVLQKSSRETLRLTEVTLQLTGR